MLQQMLQDPQFQQYQRSYEEGWILFNEGDESQDLYVLISGQLEVQKGKTRIAQIEEAGSVFGDMSFLLGGKRTATVRAMSDVTALMIPKDEIEDIFQLYPELELRVSRDLAGRLERMSQILYGLSEFVDGLPDAVIITDPNGKIISWNTPASKLFGRSWEQMHDAAAAEAFSDPAAYQALCKRVADGEQIKEEVLAVEHPQKGIRYLALSMSMLMDGQRRFAGVFSLARDVTGHYRMQQRLRRARFWLIPSLSALAILIAAVLYGLPIFSRGYQALDRPKIELRNKLAKDFVALRALLLPHLFRADGEQIKKQLRSYYGMQSKENIPHYGVVLLDNKKKVVFAYSLTQGREATQKAGTTYAHLTFMGEEDSLHRVITLWRVGKGEKGSHKGIEVAFIMADDTGQRAGWLVFQMDLKRLSKVYKLDEEGLLRFRFHEGG